MNFCCVLCFVHMYWIDWLQPHYCSPVIECLVLPLTLFFPLPPTLSPLSLCTLQQVPSVLHFTADSTCWGSTFNIITTPDICGLHVLWLAEEPVTLEMQTANEVSAPGAVRKMVNQWHLVPWQCWHTRPLQTVENTQLDTYSTSPNSLDLAEAVLSLYTLHNVKRFSCFYYPAVLVSVLY